MRTLLTLLVRIILLMVLGVGLVIVYYAAKDAINDLKENDESR